MQIKILGNGGALSDGLPYNSFMLDDYFLTETPPDIMNSLFREKSDISKIEIIYISHFHGDHYFGLPFLLLRIFFNSISKPSGRKIKIIGPQGIKEKSKELCRLALGAIHPVNNWIDGNLIFVEVTSGSIVDIDKDISLKIFQMDHFIETYGFSLYLDNNILFSYFADTLWSDFLLPVIGSFPKVIIADLNGESDDPVKVHMSEEDIIQKAIPHSDGKVTFYGTHLKKEKFSIHENIKYVHPGDIIILK